MQKQSEFPSFQRLNNTALHGCTTFCSTIQMLIHTYLSCLHILAIVKNHVLTIVMNVAVNTDVQILSLRDPAFSSSDYMPRSGIAGPFGKSGFPSGASGQESACQHQRRKRFGFDPWVGKIPWRRAWQPTPEFLPGESHGLRSLVG